MRERWRNRRPTDALSGSLWRWQLNREDLQRERLHTHATGFFFLSLSFAIYTEPGVEFPPVYIYICIFLSLRPLGLQTMRSRANFRVRIIYSILLKLETRDEFPKRLSYCKYQWYDIYLIRGNYSHCSYMILIQEEQTKVGGRGDIFRRMYITFPDSFRTIQTCKVHQAWCETDLEPLSDLKRTCAGN